MEFVPITLLELLIKLHLRHRYLNFDHTLVCETRNGILNYTTHKHKNT
jgi:hypothetical protein